MKAVCLIREQPHYRRDAFVDGLTKAGYKVDGPGGRPHTANDLLVIWNRYGHFDHQATTWEQQGGTVLVCENGYAGRDDKGRQYYAIAKHGHNGSGVWPTDDGSRFAALGIDPAPWRDWGDHIVVRGQRGIGTHQMASPPDWHGQTARQLRSITQRDIRVVQHPGNVSPKPTDSLYSAWACVIWASSLGVQALLQGVPVIYKAPHWICSGAASNDLATVDRPLYDDASRLAALERMAWAQWSVAEIASGEPFMRLRCL